MPQPPNLFYLPCSKSLVDTIICVLEHISQGNAKVQLNEQDHQDFALFTEEWTYQWMTVRDYVTRLVQHAACGKEVFIVALCLLKRLEDFNAIPPITPLTVHRCYLGALVIAIKMCEDQTLKSCDLAVVGCVTPHQMWLLEHYMFRALQYNCFVEVNEYNNCKEHLFSFETVRAEAAVNQHASFLAVGEVMSINSLFDFIDSHLQEEREKMRQSQRRPMSVALWASTGPPALTNLTSESPKPPPTPAEPSPTLESPLPPPSTRRSKFKLFSARHHTTPRNASARGGGAETNPQVGIVSKTSSTAQMPPPASRKRKLSERLKRHKSVTQNHAVFLIRQDSS